MRIKKVIYFPVFTILFCSSCTRIDIKNYDKFELSYKDYANIDGHLYKYLKKDASKKLGEKTLDLYKNILESNEKYSDLYNSEGVTQVKCYSFDFLYQDKADYISISKNEDVVYIYNKGNRVIFRCYENLSKKYLEEIKELRDIFETTLKDSEWLFD